MGAAGGGGPWGLGSWQGWPAAGRPLGEALPAGPQGRQVPKAWALGLQRGGRPRLCPGGSLHTPGPRAECLTETWAPGLPFQGKPESCICELLLRRQTGRIRPWGVGEGAVRGKIPASAALVALPPKPLEPAARTHAQGARKCGRTRSGVSPGPPGAPRWGGGSRGSSPECPRPGGSPGRQGSSLPPPTWPQLRGRRGSQPRRHASSRAWPAAPLRESSVCPSVWEALLLLPGHRAPAPPWDLKLC